MAVSRRKLILGGALAATGVAVPTALHLNWNGRSFVRDDYVPTPPDAVGSEKSWMNWSGLQRATPIDIVYPRSEAELAERIATTSHRVRPVGSGHSFSALAPSEGLMIDVSALEGLRRFDPETGLATFGAGTRLFSVASDLHALGRALPNLPDIDVQTLAGSFATGTHGTGNELTALHDYVEAFRMVTANGEIVSVTAESNPDLFEAGKVSLGALGIITEYTLRTIPAFRLRRRMTAEPAHSLIDRIDELGETHRNFEFFYFPGTGMVAWLTHDLHEGDVSGVDAASDDEEFMAGLESLRDQFGWFPWLRRQIARSAFPTGLLEDGSDESFALLSTTRPVKFNEMEYHMPRENGPATVRQIIRMLDRKSEAFFPLEYRHVAPDSAWLSPFRDRPSASIAIHAAADERFDYFFSEFEPVFRAAGGRPHWGKLNSIGLDDARSLYDKFDAFNDIRRSLDPDGKFLNPYLAGLFGATFDA